MKDCRFILQYKKILEELYPNSKVEWKRPSSPENEEIYLNDRKVMWTVWLYKDNDFVSNPIPYDGYIVLSFKNDKDIIVNIDDGYNCNIKQSQIELELNILSPPNIVIDFLKIINDYDELYYKKIKDNWIRKNNILRAFKNG